MARIIVTGGAGFIGSHLVDRLMEEGHKVYIIDNLSSGKEDNPTDYHGLFVEDCRDFAAIDKVFEEVKPDVVYHLAAYAAEHKAAFSPVELTTNNYDAFIKVLTAGIRHGMKRIIVTSSIAAYGSIEPPFKEKDQAKPADLYGLAKLHMDETLRLMSSVHGFEWVSLRPHNVYGPRQNQRDPYRNVIGIFMNKLLKGEPYVIYGDGSMERAYSYIADVIDVMVGCLDSKKVKNEVLNVGSDYPTTLQELSDTIQKVTETKIKPKHLPARAHEVHTAVEDHSKCNRIFGYKETEIEDGIRETWEYIKTRGYQEPIYGDFEIESDKIPENWRKK